MPLILYQFYRATFLDTIANSNTCLTSSLPRHALFPCASFQYHQKVFGAMDRTPGSSQFCVQLTEEMHVDSNHFCHQLFLSLWSEFFIMYCSFLEQM